MRVDLALEADAQVEEGDLWWRAHRPAAPDLFRTELTSAMTALSETPTLGTPYRVRGLRLRRLLLRKTHYHVYFMVEPQRILIVAVWNAFRGKGPNLAHVPR